MKENESRVEERKITRTVDVPEEYEDCEFIVESASDENGWFNQYKNQRKTADNKDDYDHSVGDDEEDFDDSYDSYDEDSDELEENSEEMEDSNESEESSEDVEDSNESEEPAESEESEEYDEEDDNDKLPIWFWLTGAVVVILAVFGIGRFIYQNFESSKISGSVLISATDVTKYVVQKETETEVATETEIETETETEIETEPEYENTPIEAKVFLGIIARRGLGLTETKKEIAEASTAASNQKPPIKKPAATTVVQQPQSPLPKPLPQQPPKNETPPQPSTEPPKEDPPKEEPPKEEPKKKDVKVVIANKSSIYGEKLEDLDFSVTGVKKEEIKPYLTLTKEQGNNVGNYPITGTCSSSKWNVTIVPATYTITQRSLTVKIDDKQSMEGEALQQLSFTITFGNIVNGDTVISLSTNADPSVIGECPISGQPINSNYSIQIEEGTYRVKAAPHIPKDDEEEVGPGSGDNPPGPSDPKEEVEPDKPTPSDPKDAEEGNSSDDTSSGPSDSDEEVNPYNPTPSAPKDIEENLELVTTNKFTN